MRVKIHGPKRRLLGIVFAVLLCLAPDAHAHKVSIYAYAEGGMVFAEGYFADGTRSRNSLIEVIDARTGEKLLEGRTDAEGRFSFKIPKVAPLKLVIHAGMGHKGDYTLTEEEIREAMDRTPARETTVDASELEEAVERAVKRQLRPVIRMLVRLQEEAERPGITEILGGIGYIIGLMGVAMYFKSRR